MRVKLPGRLLLARAAWCVLVGLTLALLLVSLPVSYRAMLSVCRDPAGACGYQLLPDQAQRLAGAGLSLETYALLTTVEQMAAAIVYSLVGIVIFWRRGRERIAWFVSLMLLTFIPSFTGNLDLLGGRGLGWHLAAAIIGSIGAGSFYLFFYIFPDGHFVPGWTRFVFAVGGAAALLTIFFPGSVLDLNRWSSALKDAVFTMMLLTAIGSQVYRYRRVSGPEQRQQTKWVVYGAAVSLSGLLLAAFAIMPAVAGLGGIFAILSQPVVDNALLYGFLLLVPLSLGAAILRSRLWDIDILIRRTLVYTMLTAALALTYSGSVVVLQIAARSLFAPVGPGAGGRSSTIITVLSTLLIAALFTPLRRHLQARVDRRFFRRKYDADRILATFGAALRDEVDLQRLADELVAVVEETVQPAQVALWLPGRPRAGGGG